MNKEQFLGVSLHTGLKCNAINDEYYAPQIAKELYRIETGKTEKSNIYDWFCIIGDIECKIDDVIPIARPLSDLTKPITHNGETFVPIVELAKMCKVNLKLTGEWVVDESLAQNCVRIQDNYFWYNGDSFLYSILAKKEYKMIVHNQQELLFKLIEWHFNLMDESEPFIPVTNEFNPYK